MAKNGDEIDIVEPDWLELERQRIDALGPRFERLVDKAMSKKLGCPPAKRDDVRLSLYRTVRTSGERRFLEQSLGRATPTKWLKQVETKAKSLAKLLREAISADQSLTVELASDDLRQFYGEGSAQLGTRGDTAGVSNGTTSGDHQRRKCRSAGEAS